MAPADLAGDQAGERVVRRRPGLLGQDLGEPVDHLPAQLLQARHQRRRGPHHLEDPPEPRARLTAPAAPSRRRTARRGQGKG
ncbi:hypothetical protein [Actinomadura rugatobispora]|uniref:Uncharacterized protein n=1 Tax=Actinomadura rugatobispora TaxID=1994 RepID=A0ABW0ZS91_9ACTN